MQTRRSYKKGEGCSCSWEAKVKEPYTNKQVDKYSKDMSKAKAADIYKQLKSRLDIGFLE